MKQVLYLCTGNYYRSRFAEIFFNWHAGQRGCLWKAESRGLAPDPLNPGPMSRHTVDRLRTLGVSLDAYQRLPLTVTTDDFIAADHVVAVKGAEHRPMIERTFGSGKNANSDNVFRRGIDFHVIKNPLGHDIEELRAEAAALLGIAVP